MAWSASKNDIFFRRAQNWARSVQNLLEERDRLVAIYNNEAAGDPDFVNHPTIATIAELGQLKEVMDSLDAMVNNGAVTQQNRVDKLTPFLVEQ